jgi:hypothetical protein
VKVELLDDVADFAFDGLAAPRAFLKLDTQGYDWHVIEGGKGMIGAHVLGMQIEIAVRALYAGVPLFPDNVRPFLALGFDVTGIFPLSHTPDLIAAIEYDLVLRRTTF